MGRFARYAWGVLAFNLGVVAWGAYVRATGSGAGCGAHWPTCQGEIIPRSGAMETLVEYSHRVTSGLALLLVLGLVVGAFLAYGKGSSVRRMAVVSGGLMILEALLGAALVLFGLVAQNASAARALVMPVHLINTFLLLGAIALTAWAASGGGLPRLRGQGALGLSLLGAVAGMILLGVSGALTALGDTLFPAASLIEGWRQDFTPAAHFLIKLRVAHPVIAMAVGLYVAGVAVATQLARDSRPVRILARVLVTVFAIQLVAGVVNLLLLAPVWMQLLHLVLADLTWLALVLLFAATTAAGGAEPASLLARARSPVTPGRLAQPSR